MPRIRTIKPEFWTDSKTGKLSGDATKLFIGMLNFCDDYGFIEKDIDQLKAKIFPYSSGQSKDIVGNPLSQELISASLVIPITWEGKEYLWIRGFERHQRVDHPSSHIINNFKNEDFQKYLKSKGLENHSRILANPRESSLCKGREGNSNGIVREGNGIDIVNPPSSQPPESLLTAWNHQASKLPRATQLSNNRRKKCLIRLSERSLKEWADLFSRMNQTPFLCGDNDRGWTATFDWIINNQDNAIKVLEGKYDKAQKVNKGIDAIRRLRESEGRG